MTTEPTDLREKIAARIQPFLAMNYPCKCAPDDPTCDREWSEAEELADAVLPIVREAFVKVWEQGYVDCWNYHNSGGLAGTDRNPYERSTDDE